MKSKIKGERQATEAGVDPRESKNLKRALSGSPKNPQKVNGERIKAQRATEVKTRLVSTNNEFRETKKGLQRVFYCVDREENRPKTRKQKIGLTLKGMKNQAASDIDQLMNFYSTEPKAGSKGQNIGTLVGSRKEMKKRDSKKDCTSQARKDDESQVKAPNKSCNKLPSQKHGSNLKRINTPCANNSGVAKSFKNRKGEEPARRTNTSPLKADKWSKIAKLMKKLKQKVEKEDPQRISVFKNIEKILKHAKKHKGKKKDGERSPKREPLGCNRTAVLKENKKKGCGEADGNQHPIDKSNKTGQLGGKESAPMLQQRVLGGFNNYTEASGSKCRKAVNLELQSTNNYFFMPKRTEVEPVVVLNTANLQTPPKDKSSHLVSSNARKLSRLQDPSKHCGDLTNEAKGSYRWIGNLAGSGKSSNSRARQRSLRIHEKQDMEVWATPSQHSVERISNELGFKLNRSRLGDKAIKSMKNSFVVYHRRGRKESERSSIRLDSMANFSREIRQIDTKAVRSCKDFEQDAIVGDEATSFMLDSIVKQPNRDLIDKEGRELVYSDTMAKSWTDVQHIEKEEGRAMDSRSHVLSNRKDEGDRINPIAKEMLSDSKVLFKKKVHVGELPNLEPIVLNSKPGETLEEEILDGLVDDLVRDGVYRKFILGLLTEEGSRQLEDQKQWSYNATAGNDESVTGSDILRHHGDLSSKFTAPITDPIAIKRDITSAMIETPAAIDMPSKEKLEGSKEEETLMEDSEETVYAIRTHFNAINEYLLILTAPMESPEHFSPKKLINEDAIRSTGVDRLFNLTKHLCVYNKQYYVTLIDEFMSISGCEELFNRAEKDILAHCNNLASMEDLIAIQRNFHRSIFDCFMYNFAKLLIDKVVRVRRLPPDLLHEVNYNWLR